MGLKQKIFITGGCGFIGVNLVRFLLSRHSGSIIVYDNLSTGKAGYIEEINNFFKTRQRKVELIIGDIRDEKALKKSVKDVDIIIHLAAYTNVVESVKNPQENFDVNVAGTINLLECARAEEIDKFIFASSNAAVGETTPPIDEEKIPRPISPYGVAKLSGEALCARFYHYFGIRTVSLRFANAYGSYSDRKSSVIAQYMKWAIKKRSLIIYGDGEQTRDFVHVDDICNAINLCLKKIDEGDSIAGEIFQVGTERQTRIKDLAQLICKVTDRKLDIDYLAERKGEIKKNYSSISKAKKKLGFEPQTDLETGLHNLWKWFEQG